MTEHNISLTPDQNILGGSCMSDPYPSCNIVLRHNNGKELVLSFTTDSLKVSGDLPIDEGANMFLEYLKRYWVDVLRATKEGRHLEEEIQKAVKAERKLLETEYIKTVKDEYTRGRNDEREETYFLEHGMYPDDRKVE
jgi:hypothetical protein